MAAGTLTQALCHTQPSACHLCDLNLRPPFVTPQVVEDSLRKAHVVKLNETEAQRLSDWFGVPDPVDYLLQQRTVRLVALTRGDRGAALTTAGEQVDHPGFPVDLQAGDPVGAGDAFTAALAMFLPLRLPLASLVRTANQYAASVASQRGAMPQVPAALLEELSALAATCV
ncbi:carbohydrate kinase family protein [Myxococcota bacterium]